MVFLVGDEVGYLAGRAGVGALELVVGRLDEQVGGAGGGGGQFAVVDVVDCDYVFVLVVFVEGIDPVQGYCSR